MSRMHLARSAPWLLAALVPLGALTISGCVTTPTVLNPASPEANQVSDLFWGVLVPAVAIFLLVETLLLVAVVRFRGRAGAPTPPQTHGNLPLESAWTLAPAVILAGVFVATVSTIFTVTEDKPDSLHVQVTGHQWWWEIQYPDQRIITATDLHVPVGQPVKVELHSADVIHSFWPPRLSGKTDTIPGHTNWLRFTAREPGIFRGHCGEFCGDQHANMGFLVISEPQEQFDEWVREMQSAPGVPTEGSAARGAEAFVTRPCWTCHAIEGTRAQSRVGPDLTHFASRHTIAALTLDNTPENLARWLENPPAIKPGVKMPNLNLDRATIQDLVAYLQTLK